MRGILITFNCICLTGFCSALDFTVNEVNYFKVLQNVRNISQQALKYSSDQGNVKRGKILYRNIDDVIGQAEDILTSGLESNPLYEVSELCLNHTKLFLEGIVKREQWALRMVDSMGKPESDLLDGNVRWVGNWEECRAVQASVNSTDGTEIVHPYSGKYCIAIVPVAQSAAYIGMCFPDSCSQSDASALLNTFTSLLPVPVSPGWCSCQENTLEYTDKAIAVIVVCSVFLAVIILATAYDVTIRHIIPKMQDDSSNKESEGDLGPLSHVPVREISRKSHVTEEKMPLLDDSYQKDMVSHHSLDIKKIQPKKDKSQSPTYQPGLAGKLLLSFSVYTNGSKLLNTNTPAGTLTSVNGVRFISMMWVILGHTYYFGLNVADNAATFLSKAFKRFTFQAIANETVAVDTFFVLSGLLVAYLTLREMKKRGGPRRFNWLMFYFHRFWRLTPPYMLFLMLYVPTIRYYADGPFWAQQGIETDECKNWWTNLLYINNLVNTDKMCMGWSWYLANDMQFYVISPLMLIPLYYSNVLGGLVCLAFILGNFITSGFISRHNEMQANILFNTNPNETGEIYMKPWCRVGPYAVGIYAGYLLYRSNCKVKMPKLQLRILNMIGWLVATTFALLVLYGLYSPDGDPTLGLDTAAFYNATARTAWGLAVAWVVLSCATGYGGPVNTLLSWKGIIPLSRLTYCAYLVHPVVMMTYYYSRRTLIHYYDLNMVYLFLGNMCMSYAVAFVVSLAFESPMMGLEKVLLGRKKNS